MGGMIILLSVILPTVLWGNIENIYIQIVLIATSFMGLIGLLDDYLKVVKTPPLPKSRSKHSRKVNYKNRISVELAENMLTELMEKADGNIALPRIDRDSSEFSDPVEKPPPELDNFHDQHVTFKYCLKYICKLHRH